MAGQLLKEYYGLLIVAGVVSVAVLAGFFTQNFGVNMPSLWLFGIIMGLILSFVIPFIASVRFHSPNIFDGDGNAWSFNEEQMVSISAYGTNMAVIASGGFDNPKKLLAHENISGSRTTLLLAPARLVESVGGHRFVVIRAPLRRLSLWEAKAVLAHPKVMSKASEWNVSHAVIYMALWSTLSLLPPTFSKPRADFDRIASYLARLTGEISTRRETVEVSWRRTLNEIERIRRAGPPPPPAQPKEAEREEQR